MSELAMRECVPCRGGVPPLEGKQIEELLAKVNGWEAVQEHHLRKEYKFSDYAAALKFVNQLSEIAEQQGHHPDVCFGWGRVEVSIWTHKINGLTESDFILAAKIDQI